MEINLKAYRKSKKLTQKQLADILNVKVRTYASWERQENYLSLENAIRLADFYDISLDKLCSRTKYYDVMEQINETTLRQLLINYNKLNEDGKYNLLSISRSIVCNPDYCKY